MVELTRARRAPMWALVAAVVLTACSDSSEEPEAASSSTTERSTSTFATRTTTTTPPATSPALVAPIIADLLDQFEATWGEVLTDPRSVIVDPEHAARAVLDSLFTADSPQRSLHDEVLASAPTTASRAGEYGTIPIELRITRVDPAPNADTFVGELCAYGDYEEIDLVSGEVVSDPAEQAFSYIGPLEARRVGGEWRLYDFVPAGPETQIVFPAGQGNPCNEETLP